jgi:hypothetical protein
LQAFIAALFAGAAVALARNDGIKFHGWLFERPDFCADKSVATAARVSKQSRCQRIFGNFFIFTPCLYKEFIIAKKV